LAEHRELHAIWSVLTNHKKGYSRHPETLRWKGRLKALYARHDRLVREMAARGYKHQSPLNKRLAAGSAIQTEYVTPRGEQLMLLKRKGCQCNTRRRMR